MCVEKLRKKSKQKNEFSVILTAMSQSAPAVSVVIPLAAEEESWRQVLPQLPDDWEVLLAAAVPPPSDWQETTFRRWLHCSRPGRGAQMNAAAEEATAELLWFVHADSRLSDNAVEALQKSVSAAPRAVHYFDLRFYDGGWRMRINEIGVRLRCLLFGNPFGDQALAVRRDIFMTLGGYPESAAAGEDHLFVLHAAREGIRPRRTGAIVSTSARTYMMRGWWRTMREYQAIWWRQWRQR